MDFGLHLPNLGERDGALADLVALLRVGDTVILAFALQPWIAWFLAFPHAAEEGLEGEFDANGDILQDLAVNGGQFLMGLFPLCHFLLLVAHRRGFALRLIADGSLMNKAVIDITADSKRLVKRSLLHTIGEKSILYTEPVHNCIIPNLM